MRKGNLAQQNISNLNAEPRTSKAHGNQARRSQDRNRRGFTLPEVLLTVAILVVIFAVTVVGVSKFQQSLRQKELDSKAEIIYMAAQNRITELMASGRSDLYTPAAEGTDTTELTSTGYTFTARELTVTPRDAKYSGTAGEADNKNKLYYVTSDNKDTLTTASVLLPADRVDQEIRENHWIIEYNPTQGTIYAVFYSEKSMDYADNQEKFNDYREKRIRQKQTDATIGYYGGDFILETEEVTELIPSVTIYNEEKLYAVIECKAPTDVSNLKLEITIEDAFGNKKTISGTDLNLKKTGSESWLCDTLVLDDLTEGNRFKDKYTNLVPGSDITVTCVASASKMIDTATAKATDNSLFASVAFTGSGSSTTSGTALTEGTATIKYARHLQNLDEGSGVNDNTALKTSASGKQQQLTITKAVQENNIHFDDDESTDEDWYSLYYESAPFKSIENDVLMSYSGSFASGDTSGSCSIHGLNTTGGLFNTFYGTELKDITLTGTTITGGNTSGNAGALCAETTSGALTVTGCKVYLDSSEGDVSTAKADDNGNMKHWISGSNYVGGLIGHVQNTVTIENSLAATVAGNTTTKNTGGLLGYVASSGSVTINKSYADCYLYGKTVGGLVGGGTNVSITNSYAVGYIYASSKAAGLVPAEIQSASSSYAAMSFEGDLDKVTAHAMTEGYSGTTSKLYYIPFQSIQHENGESSTYSSDEHKSTFINDLNGTETVFTSGTANPYNIKSQGLTADYTYPAINGMVNYGDWRASFQSGKLVYYEKYGDGSYGIFGANTSSLKSNATVVGDGYGVVYSAESTDEVTVTYKNKDGNDATGTLSEQVEITITDGNGKTSSAYLRALPKEAVNTEYAPTGFYQTVTIGGSDVWYYNPHFAKTQMQTEPKSTDAVSEVYVRTARQLYNLSKYYENYYNKTQKSLYTQEIDIDYTTYDWTTYYGTNVTKQDPIGNGDEKIFTSKYNGGSHTISGISFVNTNTNSFYAGMFGYNQGTLSNIFVVWDYKGDDEDNPTVELDASVTGADKSAYIGVLAGRNKKTITNCGVTGYKISCESTNGSTAYIGGLVGQNDGKITKSYADVPYILEEPSSSTVKIGGFVGRNESRISYCYASSAIRVTKAQESTVELGGFYGENTSVISYAYCTTAFYRTEGVNGYGFGPAGGTLTDCYYLTRGTYSYVGNITTYGNLTEGHAGAQAVTKAKELRNKTIPGFSDAVSSSYDTLTKDTSSTKFPYPAIATDANGEVVHYGNWATRAELGGVGVFYWEHETEGTNNGYHLSYIGIGDTTKKTSSLCTAHDDGGIIDEYGYGYYIEKNEDDQVVGTASLTMTGFGNSTSTENKSANNGLEEQLDGFEIHAYTTGTGTGQLYLDKGVTNGTWEIKYNNEKDGEKTYTFEVCPFFANAFSYSGTSGTGTAMTAPGTSDNQYEIRSAAQLQYINWNAYNKDATSAVVSQSSDYNNYFTYLSYLRSRGTTNGNTTTYKYTTDNRKVYYWLQSHDVDNNSEDFTPIGSLFYNSNEDEGDADIAGFTGTYDGGEYMVKNLNISEDRQMIGLFGITIGADLKNIFIYSESDKNVIENKKYTSGRTSDSADYNYRWYCIGGLVGFAAEGTDNTNASITNCSVAGYTIKDNRSRNGGWGGASIGGLAGACNMTIERCTAVNDIEINISWASTDTKNNPDTHKNIRVGGLIGNLRGTVDSCYSGGSITGTENAKSSYYETSYSSSSKTYKNTDTTGAANPSIWAGGISGGIVMIDYGVSGLIGNTNSVVTVKNSYSYVQMPESGYRLVKSSQSIASIGEMQSTAFNTITEPNAYIFNCYAYEPNVEKTDDYKSKNGSTYWNGGDNIHTGNSTSNNLRIYNGGKDPYLTYAQFSAGQNNTSGALYLLKNNGSKCSATINNKTYTAGTSSFSFVTVSENGMRVDGKYSYPAGETSLADANYPFPTILTQKKSSTETVNVHYGKWPSGSISWVNGRKLTFDLLDNYDSTLQAATFPYSLKATGEPSFSYFDDKGNAIAKDKSNVTAKNESNSDGTYNITVTAIDKGTEYIRAAVGDELNDNDLWVNITAILDLSATNPQEITLTLPAEGSTEAMPSNTITLSAKSKSGTKDFTSQTAWSFELEDDGEKVVSYNPETIAVGETAEVKVTAVGEGSTSLTATASYTIKLNGKDKTFTQPIIIHITVNKPAGSTEGTN